MCQLGGGGSFDATLIPNNTFPAFTRKAEERGENNLEKLEQCLCQIDHSSYGLRIVYTQFRSTRQFVSEPTFL